MPPKDSEQVEDKENKDQPSDSSGRKLAVDLDEITTASSQENEAPTRDQIIKIGRDIAKTIHCNTGKEASAILNDVIKFPEYDEEIEIIELLGSAKDLIDIQARIDQAEDDVEKKKLKQSILDITKNVLNFILKHRNEVPMSELTEWMTKASLPGQADAVKFSPGLYDKRKKMIGGIIKGIAGEVAIGLLFRDRSGHHHEVEFASASQDLTGIDVIIHSLSHPDRTLPVDIKTQPIVTNSGAPDNGTRVPINQAICRRDWKTSREQIWIHPDCLADNYQIHPSYDDDIYTGIISRQDILR